MKNYKRASYEEKKEKFLTSYILSLPLLYSVSKLGCFFAGCCYGTTIFLIAIFKFALNYLRQSHVGIILSVNQYVSIVFCIIAIILIIKKRKIKESTN